MAEVLVPPCQRAGNESLVRPSKILDAALLRANLGGSQTVKTMLFVDDHPVTACSALTDALPELRIFTAAGVGSALELLAKTRGIDFCLADYRLTDGNGLPLLEEVRRRYPEIAIGCCAPIRWFGMPRSGC
jgi:hypothetical protein